MDEIEKFNRKIERRVKKKNEKILIKYPLFYEQYKTDFKTEENGVLESAYTCEQLFERLNYLKWRNTFKIEIAKRILTNLGRRDLIYRRYYIYFKFHRQITNLLDDLNSTIANLLNKHPMIINRFINIRLI